MTGARKVTIKEPVPVEDEVKTEQDKPEPEPESEENENEDDAYKPTEEELAAHEAEKYGDKADEGDESDEKPEPTLDEIVASAANDPDYNWAPGQPCLTCGARNYKYTVGWGKACSECLDLD